MELLPTSAIGEANHKVIVARVDIGGNLDIMAGIVSALAGRNGEV